MSARPRQDPYMTNAEIASLFRVTTATVWDWGRTGKLTRTRPRPGAHWRYSEGEVRELYRRSVRERAS